MGEKDVTLWQDWGPGGDRGSQVDTHEQSGITRMTAMDLAPASATLAVSSLSEQTQERAVVVGEGFLESCPDPEGFNDELGKLPREDLDLLASIIANHLRPGDNPYDVAVKYEHKASIPQILRARAWYQQLPAHLQRWLLDFREE